MPNIRARLNRLETYTRATEPDLHAACWRLLLGRWNADPNHVMPKVECFHGPAEDCPQQQRATRLALNLEHLCAPADYIPSGEREPILSPEALAEREQSLAAHRAHMLKLLRLPTLEARLVRAKQQQGRI